MRESIGSTALYNIVITFLSIVFALILGTIVYYQAFKVNKNIVNIIQKYEGYNKPAREEIESKLSSIGYMRRNLGDCPQKRSGSVVGVPLVNSSVNSTSYKSAYPYCVYRFQTSGKYYYFGVISYIVIDIPLIKDSLLKFGVYSETDKLYKFG